MKWSYGITTVPSRLDGLFPSTLRSLAQAGFDRPRLFVDDVPVSQYRTYLDRYHLEITFRTPKIRTFGNWALGLAELWIREPNADRYAMFQDDFQTVRNLRAYLEQTPYPEKGYLNLYTFPENQALARVRGFYPSNQRGRGAVALVFDRDAVRALLSQAHMIDRPMDCKKGWRSIDGGIVTAMQKAGYTEFVHNPSLVQHTGRVSSMGNRPHKLALTFPGENFDASLLLTV